MDLSHETRSIVFFVCCIIQNSESCFANIINTWCHLARGKADSNRPRDMVRINAGTAGGDERSVEFTRLAGEAKRTKWANSIRIPGGIAPSSLLPYSCLPASTPHQISGCCCCYCRCQDERAAWRRAAAAAYAEERASHSLPIRCRRHADFRSNFIVAKFGGCRQGALWVHWHCIVARRGRNKTTSEEYWPHSLTSFD